MPAPDRISYLRLFKIATNAFDAEIGDLIGIKRPLVQAYISGKSVEYLDDRQKKILRDALRDHIQRAQELLDTMELLA